MTKIRVSVPDPGRTSYNHRFISDEIWISKESYVRYGKYSRWKQVLIQLRSNAADKVTTLPLVFPPHFGKLGPVRNLGGTFSRWRCYPMRTSLKLQGWEDKTRQKIAAVRHDTKNSTGGDIQEAPDSRPTVAL